MENRAGTQRRRWALDPEGTRQALHPPPCRDVPSTLRATGVLSILEEDRGLEGPVIDAWRGDRAETWREVGGR